MLRKFRAIALALLLPFILIGCGKSEQPQEENESTQNVVQENQNKVSYKIIIEKHVYEEVSIEYPQFDGLGEELDARLNKQFKDGALAYQNEKSEQGDLVYNPKIVTYEVKCEIKTQTPDVISICMPSYISIPDAAHPSASVVTYNIDPKTGEDIKLNEIGNISEYAQNIFSGKYSSKEDGELGDAIKNFFTEDNGFYKSAKELENELNEYNSFYIENGKPVIIVNVPHALGDYAELVMDK